MLTDAHFHSPRRRAADFSFGQPPCFVQLQTVPRGVETQICGVQIVPKGVVTQAAFAMVVAARMEAIAMVEMMSLRMFVLHD
jgi:hypothetical protein